MIDCLLCFSNSSSSDSEKEKKPSEETHHKHKKEKKKKHKHKHKHKSHHGTKDRQHKHKHKHKKNKRSRHDSEKADNSKKKPKLDDTDIEELERARAILTAKLSGQEVTPPPGMNEPLVSAMSLIAQGYMSESEEEGELDHQQVKDTYIEVKLREFAEKQLSTCSNSAQNSAPNSTNGDAIIVSAAEEDDDVVFVKESQQSRGSSLDHNKHPRRDGASPDSSYYSHRSHYSRDKENKSPPRHRYSPETESTLSRAREIDQGMDRHRDRDGRDYVDLDREMDSVNHGSDRNRTRSRSQDGARDWGRDMGPTAVRNRDLDRVRDRERGRDSDSRGRESDSRGRDADRGLKRNDSHEYGHSPNGSRPDRENISYMCHK